MLISDIILKSFITEGLNKSGAQVSKTLFTVLQDFKITKKCDFFQKLDELVQSHNLQLLLVYPFLIPQEDIDDVLGLLKRFAQKNKITIVMNIPEEKILLDYNRINITEIDSVLKTTAPVIIHNLNNHFRSFKLEVECMKTNAKRSYQVILNEKKQLIQSYRHSDVVVA